MASSFQFVYSGTISSKTPSPVPFLSSMMSDIFVTGAIGNLVSEPLTNFPSPYVPTTFDVDHIFVSGWFVLKSQNLDVYFP